jgi:hypothetical protein
MSPVCHRGAQGLKAFFDGLGVADLQDKITLSEPSLLPFYRDDMGPDMG